VTVTEELVTIQLGSIQISLPEPLVKPCRELAANPGRDLTASHPNSNRVFLGISPGRHILPGPLTRRLNRLFSTQARGTRDPPRTARVDVIAETMDYSPAIIERHPTDSAPAYAQYIAAARTSRQGL
jgi:hypothetical protein